MWTIALPLKVRVTKKKERYFQINLNHYRNTNPFTLNTAKEVFGEIVGPRIRAAGIPRLKMFTLDYFLFAPNAQLCDTNNICSVADKFFADALVDEGVVEDDNYNLLVDTRFRFGGIDRENPRVEVVVRSPDHISAVHPELLQESQRAMKIETKKTTIIKLSTKDVEQALKEYLATRTDVSPDSEFKLKETKDGYEIRVEQDETVTVGDEENKKPGKVRLEPKEAMAALSAAKHPEASAQVESEPRVASEPLPLVGEEKGHAEAPETVQETAPASPPPSPPKSLFSAFTRPKN